MMVSEWLWKCLLMKEKHGPIYRVKQVNHFHRRIIGLIYIPSVKVPLKMHNNLRSFFRIILDREQSYIDAGLKNEILLSL